MNATRPHDPLDDVLRSLDAAPACLTPEQSARADALLESLVATPRTPRRHVARWLVPVAAASALVAGALALPGSPVGGNAYADWTPEPTPITGPALEQLTAACRSQMAAAERGEGPIRGVARADTARVVVAEQRGSNLFIAMASDNDATMQCMARADTPGRINGATGGFPTTAAAPAPLASDAVEAFGPGLHGGPEGSYAFLQGRVGSNVRSVTLRVDGRVVAASVANGYFAAWWPSEAPEHPSDVDTHAITVDATLADGSVLTDVPTGMVRVVPLGPSEIGRIGTGGGVEHGKSIVWLNGAVGSRVTQVTVHVDGVDRVATVANGTFKVVWDAPASGAASDDVTFTLTLDDGTVLSHVKAVSGVRR